MSVRKVFSLICMILTLYLIGNMFIPYLSYGSESMSFWKTLEQTSTIVPVLFLIVLIIAALLYLLQLVGAFKENRTVFLPVGYVFFYSINSLITFIDKEYMDYTSAGFWLLLIFSFVIVILTIISNYVKNESKPKYKPAIIGYDPKTGQPIYAGQTTQPRFDSKTGKPL